MTASKVYKVPSANMGVLADKFKKMARRAKRLDLPAPTYTEIKTERVENKNGDIYLLHHLVVDPGCVEVKVAGWTFIATIQHTDAGNIIRAVGDQEIPHKYREVTQLCEHCNKVRNRKDTYILKHEDGSTKQVGRNCLADFFGHDALMYAERAQYLVDVDDLGESMEDDFGFGGRGGPRFTALEQYLPYVAEVIKLNGWMSKKSAREMDIPSAATSVVAENHMKPKEAPPGYKFLFSTPSEESHKMAEAAIEWCAELEGEELPEYLHNIRIIARRMVCEPRDMGMAASIISAYQREMMKRRLAELKEKRAEISKHVGTVGDKLRKKLLLEEVRLIVPLYGGYSKHLHEMSDEDGNVYTWWSSSAVLEAGKEYILEGTLKSHTEYKGVKQNVLTRCSEVVLKNYYTVIEDQILKFEGASEDEVKKLIRAHLNIKRLPKGTRIIQEVVENVDTL